MRRLWAFLGCGLLAGSSLHVRAQWDDVAKPKSYVVYTAEAQTVPARRPTTVALRFHVDDGFHVNSHTPKSDLLIPTVLTVTMADSGVKPGQPEYPAGTSYSFSFDPTNKLDVYQGDFTVKVPVVASTGEHTLKGTLRYQACDRAACYPPKTLPVEAVFTAK